MAFSRTPKLGLTRYADLIDLMGQHPDWFYRQFDRQPHFSLETTAALGYEFSAAVEEEKKRFDEARLDHSFRTDTEILLLLTLQEKHGRIEKQREEQKNGHEVTL